MPRERSIKLQIEIGAPVQTVWKALTNPKELVRWLPLQAKVKPGKGGLMWLSWGEPVVEESKIEVWKPNGHLQLKEIRPFGAPFQPKILTKVQRTIDFTLESVSSNTLLQLEHSGFGAGSSAELDAFINQLLACWEFQLNALDAYVTRHLGENRNVSWARTISPLSFTKTWNRVMGSQGFLSEGRLNARSEKGDRYQFRAANGDLFKGSVLTYTPNKQFAGIVENMNESVLRIVLDHCGGKPEATVWLATYGAVPEGANLFEHRWTHLLQDALN